MTRAKAIPTDYDTDPDRFRANVQAVEKYGLAADVHEEVARRIATEGLGPALDLGCGEGRLSKPLLALHVPTISMDASVTMLAAVPGNRVLGDACRLPFLDESCGAVAALYMLYHLEEPRQALEESLRVLRPGGLFIACAPSRYNDPDLAGVLPPPEPETFDAENGEAMIAEFFDNVEAERWDAPLIHLPDRDALLVYLLGRQLTPSTIDHALDHIATPLHLTKRGALFYGRKPL